MTTLYGLTTCDTCKKARKWLQQFEIAHTFVDIRADLPCAHTLTGWASQRGGFPVLVNRTSTTWRQLPEARKTPADDAQWLELLREYPALIRRPLLVTDDGRVHQGFNETTYQTLFGMNP